MNQYSEGSFVLQEKFEMAINWPTLRFKDEIIEKKYHEKRLKDLSLSRTFKVGIVMLMFILAFRRFQLLIFAVTDVESISGIVSAEYIQTGLFGIALVLELLFLYTECLAMFKGFVVMVYVFFVVCYSSLIYIPSKPSSVPIGVPVYIGSVVIGAVYVHTWLAASAACIVGLVMHIFFNHRYTFPTCIFQD